MLHRHVKVMEYIENNIAVLVTVYGINQERRRYKKDPLNIMCMSLVVPHYENMSIDYIQQYFMAIKNGNFG